MNTTLAVGERIHDEHLSLIEDLARLDAGLDRLECYSEVYANLAGAEQVKLCGHRLVEQFPDHCWREEKTVLAVAGGVSAELAEFCSQMKAEHRVLLTQLSTFRAALDDFEQAEDLNEAVCRLKETGKELTRALRCHVEREEHELEGFL